MKTTHTLATQLQLNAVIASLALLPFSAMAEPWVSESFDYPGVDQPLAGSDGGVGFDGAWIVNGWSRNYDVGRTQFAPGEMGSTVNAAGGLEFGEHPVAGSALARFGTAGQREAHRIVAGGVQPLLTADNSTIWFSVLGSAPSGNRFGTMIFGTDPMLAVQGAADNGNLSAAGQGFGVTFTADGGGSGSGSPNAVAFIDSPIKTIANGSFTPPITGSHHDTSLIVGKINWKPDGTADELFLFNMAEVGLPEPAEAEAVATLTADFDQSTWTTIALWDTGATIFDEIRFGSSFGDVTGNAASAPGFEITQINRSATSVVTLTWNSRASDIYSVRYSTDLINWDADLSDSVTMAIDDEIADDGDQLTFSFDLTDFGIETEADLFFRVQTE